MMFPPFKLMSWLTSGLISGIYNNMRRSVTRGARSLFHVSSAPALALEGSGGFVYSDRQSALTQCGLADHMCGRMTLLKPAADKQMRKALWRKSQFFVQDFASL